METRLRRRGRLNREGCEPTYEEWKPLASFSVGPSSSFLVATYYEEWKRKHLFTTAMSKSSLPMRNGNSPTTLRPWTHKVASLPMRNGNWT